MEVVGATSGDAEEPKRAKSPKSSPPTLGGFATEGNTSVGGAEGNRLSLESTVVVVAGGAIVVKRSRSAMLRGFLG